MSRPQLFGKVLGGEFAADDRPGHIRIRLEDGHEVRVDATDEQIQGLSLGNPVRLSVHPTTTKTIEKLRNGGGE